MATAIFSITPACWWASVPLRELVCEPILIEGERLTLILGVTSMFAMEASPGAPSPQALDITVQNGGKAGIWHAGMGIAVDGNKFYVVTG